MALFFSLNRQHNRLIESGVEVCLREMEKKLGVERVHPHKFRRIMATKEIEKGYHLLLIREKTRERKKIC